MHIDTYVGNEPRYTADTIPHPHSAQAIVASSVAGTFAYEPPRRVDTYNGKPALRIRRVEPIEKGTLVDKVA